MTTFLDNEALNSRIDKADDFDLATRALILASGTLAVAELGLLAFSNSRRLKIAGFIAPILTLVTAMEVDQAHLKNQAAVE